jgi:hypothetical protein
MTIEVIGSRFERPDEPGDFGWMITRPDYDDALFVFNDNESEFRAHQAHGSGRSACPAGGGNAVIRPYQCQDPPRAAGVPTGDAGGYRALTDHVRATIDDALAAIRALLATGRYRRVIYSAHNDAGDLGTGIFSVSDDVKRYIVSGLQRLADADQAG